MTLLLFSEAFRSLSAGERRVSSYASLRAGSRLSRFPAGVERCFCKQRNVSYYYFSHTFLYNKRINGRNTIPPIRMFKYLLLKAMNDVSDVDLVERSKYDMSFGYGNRRSSETEIRHFLFKIEQEVPYFYLKKVRFYENINFSVPSSIHEGRFK